MTVPSPTPPATIAAALAQSGTGFDRNERDFDILNAALSATGLTGALGNPDSSLTLFAPTDAAFLTLARSFGFTGSSEQGAFDAIVNALTALSPGGNPLPLLTTVLSYHVAEGGLTKAQIAGLPSITTLAGAAITPFGASLGDLDPTAADPRIIASRADQVAGNSVIQAIDRVLLPADVPETVPSQPALPTIADLIGASGSGFDHNGRDFDILKAALDTAGLTGTLDDAAANLTLLAPTDAAFLKLAREFGFAGGDNEAAALQAIVAGLTARAADGDPVPLLREILTYHVLDGQFSRQQLDTLGGAETLQGDTLGFDGRKIIDAEPDLDARIIPGGSNIEAANGAVQTIDGVLLPFDLTGTIADELAESGRGFDRNGNDFDILNAALNAAGLTAVLDDPSADLTLFAPTDSAFVKLAQSFGFRGNAEQGAFDAIVSALTGLSPDGNPIPLLTTVLTYHVANGALTQAEIVAERGIETLAGATITPFGLSLGDLDPTVADPRLISSRADAGASNGIIQAIDRVLLPADVPEAISSQGPLPTLADIVGASGNGFDRRGNDFDILEAALDAAGLTAALDDHAASLTLLAPTDAAFITLARSFGFRGTSEQGALDTIVEALADLSDDGDPIPLLGDILSYHVLEGTLSRQVLEAEGTADTLLGPSLGFAGRTIIDAEPDAGARFVAGQTNIAAENGAFQAINAVLLPLDLDVI